MNETLIWFESGRIPAIQSWPFLNAARATVAQIKANLVDDVDMTEGGKDLLIAGCMLAYRQAVMRRLVDLTQSAVALWNLGLLTGSLVSARSLIETLAIFHAFLKRAEALAEIKDWESIGVLVNTYAFFSTADPKKRDRGAKAPPGIGKVVRDFIRATEPGKEHFWDQLSDAAHPNGKQMMEFAGNLGGNHFRAKKPLENEPVLFAALYNALYSCCWLAKAEEDFEILLEVICNGGPLPMDHPLIVARNETDNLVADVMNSLGEGKGCVKPK